MEEKEIVIRKALQKILADERFAVYKTLSAASQELYLTYPLVHTGNQKSYPSFVIFQIQEMFSNGNTLLQTEQQIPLHYYATTLQSAYYHYVRNFSDRTTEIATVQRILQKHPVYQQKIAYLQNVHQDVSFEITNPQIMEQLMGKQITMTASKLEHYLFCPFQFFCESALHLYQRQKIRLDPANQGTLIHFCLEQVLRRYKRETFLSLTETELMHLLLMYRNGCSLHYCIYKQNCSRQCFIQNIWNCQFIGIIQHFHH